MNLKIKTWRLVHIQRGESALALQDKFSGHETRI